MNPIHARYFPGGVAVNLLENFSLEHVVKLHDAVNPRELVIGSYKGKRVGEDSSTIEHLKLAQDTLRRIKMIVPYGAGNQTAEVIYTQGEPLSRSLMRNVTAPSLAPFFETKETARFLSDNGYPLIGPNCLSFMEQSHPTDTFPDEKIFAKDPNSRYASNPSNAKLVDDIAQATVSRQHAAQQACNNSPLNMR
ncbi:hypothetical protein [Brenneria rubrifaciens]|uniref:Uncharacterized protein n=1 Tax=Brenneria rubrifaciens TaxID=55213 RepID=A0A4P8QLU3_9GAMM|nr:hypothetical protein [Brenneria rubrifaciens]QCR07867.1 hypothetical protein EH207_04630 [Brenneria rubrifaciens]